MRLVEGVPARGHALDLGCGIGQTTQLLAERFEEIDAIDADAERVATAREEVGRIHPDRIDRQIRFRVQHLGVEPRPFEDATFDLVAAPAIVEHVEGIFELGDEIARVCKPGGYLILAVPNLAYVKFVLDLVRGRHPLTGAPRRDIALWREMGWDGGHLHYFTESQLTAFLEHLGVEPEAWTGDGRLARLRRWYVNFTGNLTVRARRRG